MIKKETLPLTEAAVSAAGMCLFALFSHTSMPLKSVSFFGLFLSFFALIRGLRTVVSPGTLLGLNKFSKVVAVYSAFGLVLGVVMGIAYRWGYGMELLPSAFGLFAPVAALIGATEEILYRGYIQGRVQRLGPFGAVAFAAFCHTAYKCSLFVFHNQPVQINMLFLAVCTFGVGLALGTLRERAGSVLPPLAAHVLFDIMAYGEYAQAPWWVWS